MEKYQNKYRISSARANWKNYGDQGCYFVTINTRRKNPFFGYIRHGRMCLNELGTIAHNEWLKTLILRPDMNITLHAHVVMPDHFHAVLSIGHNQHNTRSGMRDDGGDLGVGVGVDMGVDQGKDALQCVSSDPHTDQDPHMDMDPSHHPQRQITKLSAFGPQRKNLSSIVRGFKGTVTKQARIINPNFGWQTRFHDRIVPDEQAQMNIVRYINNNPQNYNKKKRK